MKFRILFLLTIVAFATFVKAQDIMNLLRDRRFVEKQISCVLNRGHCDLIGKKIRGLLPEALNNNCRHCTSRDMTHARILIDFMQRNYPHEWNLIRQYYAAMRNYGITNYRVK